MESIGSASSLNTKKIMQRPQIFDREFLLHPRNESTDKRGMCTCDNDIVHIDEEKNFNAARDMNKKGRVNQGCSKAKIKQKLRQPSVPSPRCLFKTIDGLMQFTHKGRMLGIDKAWGLFHVDLFS